MTQITFLIGNGFDLALGLKTSYQDFLASYIEESPDDNEVLRVFRNHIKQDMDGKKNWANAEEAFGAFPFSEIFPRNPVQAFQTCLANFQDELQYYLWSQEQRFDAIHNNSAQIYKLFSQALANLRFHLKSYIIDKRFPILRTTNDIAINFINYNYTNTLEQIRSTFSAASNNTFPLKMGKLVPQFHMGKFVYIHGNLDELVFGVDNLDQIKDKTIRAYAKEQENLVKSNITGALDSNNEQRAQALLNSSDYVVILGLSLGPTDKSSWKNLYRWINANASRQIIHCVYMKDDINHAATAALKVTFLHSDQNFVFRSLTDGGKTDINSLLSSNDIRHRIHIITKQDPLDLESLGSLALDKPKTSSPMGNRPPRFEGV